MKIINILGFPDLAVNFLLNGGHPGSATSEKAIVVKLYRCSPIELRIEDGGGFQESKQYS